MTTRKPPPRVPRGLRPPGARLWRDVVAVYELRPDELVLLAKACRTSDDLDRIEAELAGAPLTTKGSTGQDRAHPLLPEVRGMRALLASLFKQLGLPDEPEAPQKPSSGTQKATKAARARWDKRGGSRGA